MLARKFWLCFGFIKSRWIFYLNISCISPLQCLCFRNISSQIPNFKGSRRSHPQVVRIHEIFSLSLKGKFITFLMESCVMFVLEIPTSSPSLEGKAISFQQTKIWLWTTGVMTFMYANRFRQFWIFLKLQCALCRFKYRLDLFNVNQSVSIKNEKNLFDFFLYFQWTVRFSAK